MIELLRLMDQQLLKKLNLEHLQIDQQIQTRADIGSMVGIRMKIMVWQTDSNLIKPQ